MLRPPTSARGAAAANRALPRAPDARTLYLASPHPLRVTSTGEALVVRDHEAQVSRVPIARVLRIVCTDTAEWSGAALVLCQQRGITITWLDAVGSAQGHLWPARVRATDLAEALSALAGSVGHGMAWSASYAHWLRRQRLHVLQRWAGECARAGHPVRAPEWAQAKRGYVYLGEIPAQLPPVLQGMASSLVAARLSDCGVQPHYWCAAGDPVALQQDLTDLIWAEMNLSAGPLAAAIERPRDAAGLFERWSGTCAGAIHEHLASLRAHALSELATGGGEP